jgi:thiol:disulfide interchange protein
MLFSNIPAIQEFISLASSKKDMRNRIILTGFIISIFSTLNAQILQPVKWKFSAERVSEREAIFTATASIDPKWHLYSQDIEIGGPEPTSFTFDPNPNIQLTGKVDEQPKPIEIFDETFEMKVKWFVQKAKFIQKIKLKSKDASSLSGNVYFMTCDDKQCLPPEEVTFKVNIPAYESKKQEIAPISTEKTTPTENTQSVEEVTSTTIDSSSLNTSETISSPKESISEVEEEDKSLWGIFIAGFLGGFLALLTPCVFPMIPLTVSFFTKRAEKKSKGITQAIVYGLSIIGLYVGLGMLITIIFGADALNDMASNVYFNLLFFVLLVVFGISFLGAFEIVLPNSFINKIDSKSDKGGLIGIFFMAFTLSLVSFSCTGPIIGTLLVEAAVYGQKAGPIAGMFGFSLALALPFTLFALFPGWMKNLPKSGGWLNSVKVVLGFLELALSLKFLSNVDLAYHWGILDREVFLVLWIVIFALLGLYLLGKLKFSHDSDLPYISIPRLLLATLSLSFALYMVPGLWGAPLKAISAFSPPQATQDFDLSSVKPASHGATEITAKKYDNIFHCPHGLNCFFDYEEGMAYAKKMGKPVMIDFTGHSCVNCRKMEVSVWSDPAVLKLLNEDYVLISLYVDDKTPLAETERYVSTFSGKNIKTLGNKWSDLQASTYGVNSQPYYVLLDHEGKQLVKPRAFDLDIPAYVSFLESGKTAFQTK